MQDIVGQLGELFLQAVPTVLIIFLFYFILRAIFFKPLLRVMAEREARTVGAQKAAQSAQTAAAEKVKQYEDALKQARAKVYGEQEAARKKLLDERAETVKAARSRATAEIASAKARIEGELADARKDLDATVGQLAAEIVGRILQTPPGSNNPRREAR